MISLNIILVYLDQQDSAREIGIDRLWLGVKRVNTRLNRAEASDYL